MFGNEPAEEFTPAKLLRWIDTKYGECGNTRRHDLMAYVQTAFNWIEAHHGVPSLIKRIEKPTCDQKEFWLPADQWSMLLSRCTPHV